MTDTKPPVSTSTKPPPRTRSGQHPAVKAFRDKLDSIGEGEGKALDELDAELAAYLEDLKTPLPPKP